MIQYTHTPEIKVLLNIFYYARSALIQSILLFSSTLVHEKTKQMQSDHDPQNWFHHHWWVKVSNLKSKEPEDNYSPF